MAEGSTDGSPPMVGGLPQLAGRAAGHGGATPGEGRSNRHSHGDQAGSLEYLGGILPGTTGPRLCRGPERRHPEVRHFGDTIDRLPALAAELVRLPVDVIVTGAAPEPE